MTSGHRRALAALAAALLIPLPQTVVAQTAPPQTPPAAQPASASTQQLLSDGQLDALVAPIALYPDALLSEVLMASTYPLEVVEADRWAEDNKNLKGDALKAAVDQQSWDDSVKSLVATPVGARHDEHETRLDAAARRRGAGAAAGRHGCDPAPAQQGPGQQQARVEQATDRLDAAAERQSRSSSSRRPSPIRFMCRITIRPSSTARGRIRPIRLITCRRRDISRPACSRPGLPSAPATRSGAGLGGGYWGGGFNWGGNNININRNVNINNINRGNGNNWVHNPAHRQGVRYNNANVAAKFGGNRNNAGGVQNRMDFRGRGGQQVLNPGGGAGNRPNIGGGNQANIGGGNRPNAGGNRPSAGGGNRPNIGGGGNRPSVGGGGRGPGALGNISSGRAANMDSARGRASLGGGGGGGARRRRRRWWSRRRWRRRRSRWWRRRWRSRRRRTPLGRKAQARHRPPWTSRRRAWLLSLCL